jgi:hypothetical protein
LNNALLEEVSSQHESKMMKKLEQMEGGPKSMDQIPAKMTKPHLPLGRGLDPNLDQVPSQLACISVRARAHVSGISVTMKQTPACKRTCQTKLTCQLCGQLPLLMEHPQRPEHLPTSNLGPQIAVLQQGKYLVKAFHEQQQGRPRQQYDASEQKLDHALLS